MVATVKILTLSCALLEPSPPTTLLPRVARRVTGQMTEQLPLQVMSPTTTSLESTLKDVPMEDSPDRRVDSFGLEVHKASTGLSLVK